MINQTNKNKKSVKKNLIELWRAAQEENPSPLLQSQAEQQLRLQKERFFRQFQEHYHQAPKTERLVFSEAEQQVKLQIRAIQEELKRLALSTKDLAKEVEIAAIQAPVDPGVYHLNFLEKIRRQIILFKKRIEESATWLGEFNHRAKKRGHYWTQFKKHGTKFLLSQERYMSTQAG